MTDGIALNCFPRSRTCLSRHKWLAHSHTYGKFETHSIRHLWLPNHSFKSLAITRQAQATSEMTKSSSLQHMPIEIMIIIAGSLCPEDLLSWSLSCKQFAYLIRQNAVCRPCLLVSRLIK